MTDRRSFVAWLGSLPLVGRPRPLGAVPPIVIDATPTALYQQPDGRNNLVRVAVMGVDAPAARARVTDRRGTLVGTAGLLPTGASLAGELWVPLSRPVGAEFQIDVEVGKQRVGSRRVRLAPPRRWTLYWIASSHTDVGLTERHEECLEVHRRNLDAALARLPAHPEFRWTAECGLQLISYVENRPAAAGEALARAIRDGKLGVSAVFAQALTGILDHETFARVLWPTGLFVREHGLGYQAAQLADVPGHPFTLPTLLAASGVRYLASGVNPERAAPLLSPADAARAQLAGGDWTTYPQLYWWEGPDGSRVLHWRAGQYADGPRFGFDVDPAEMGRRLSDWLLTHPVFLSPAYPYDVALLCGATGDNALLDERVVANVEEFSRRFSYPRLVAARPEDFFREVERRWGAKLPVRRGDTGCYREDGAASTAAELGRYRAAQLAARAAELLALWDEKTEPPGGGATERIEQRAAARRRMWRDLLLFGEHTWGSPASGSDPDGADTVAQWQYKRRFLDGAAAAADAQVAAALLRIGLSIGGSGGAGRVVFNASSWARSDAGRGAHRARRHGGGGGARVGARRAAAGNRRPAHGRAQARGLHQRRDRGDAVRRAAVDGHREPDHQARHARQGSAVRRVPVRAHQAHGRGRSAARADDGGARPATRELSGLVLPRALGVAARRRGRDALERTRHAAVHAQRHLPGPVAPEDGARRHADRVCPPQLLAHELRAQPGGRALVPLPPLGAGAGWRARRDRAARLGRVRPAVRERSVCECRLGRTSPQGLRAVHRGSRRRGRGREAGRRSHRRGGEARRPDGGAARRGRLAGGLRVSRRPAYELRRDERRPRPCRAGWSRHDRPSRVGCRGTATLYTTGGGRLTIAL